jgi:hypothetical protein
MHHWQFSRNREAMMRVLGSNSLFVGCCALAMAIIAVTAQADVIRVPGDQPTIQTGIIAALQGDTVLVAPGIYTENIDYLGKNVVVASHYVLDGDNTHVMETVIDGSDAPLPSAASCVTFKSGEDSSAVLEGFTITGGAGTEWVDPQYPQYTWRGGGGIFSFMSSPTILNNLIVNNIVTNNGDVDGAAGGGLLCFDGNPLVQCNVITDNQADYGAGVVIDYSGATVKNCLVSRNTGGQVYGGGGFWTIGNGPASIIIENNTVVENVSYTRGGAMYIWSSTVTARNNVFWSNTQNQGGPIAVVGGGVAHVSYCDVEGGYTGLGNIDEAPVFTGEASFLLDPASPCIDAGDPGAVYSDPEDPENPGQAMWPAQGGLRNDMGTYGGMGCMILPTENVASAGDRQVDAWRGVTLGQSRPNPARSATTIRFELPHASDVELEIFDPAGRLITRLLGGVQGIGCHTVSWDGSDDRGNPVGSGVYFYKLRTGAGSATRRMSIVR